MKTAKQHNAPQCGEYKMFPNPNLNTAALERLFEAVGCKLTTIKAKKLRAIKRTKSKLP